MSAPIRVPAKPTGNPGSFWGGAGGALIGGLSGLVGSGLSNMLSIGEARRSWDKQKDWATRGPTYMMQGLRDAGLNPILAAGGGLGGASAAGIAQAPIGDIGQAVSTSAQTARENWKAGIERSLLKNENRLRDNAAWKTFEEAMNAIDTGKLIKENVASAKQMREIQALAIPYLKAQSDFFKTPLGSNAAKVQAGMQSVQPLLSAVSNLVPGGGLLRTAIGRNLK